MEKFLIELCTCVFATLGYGLEKEAPRDYHSLPLKLLCAFWRTLILVAGTAQALVIDNLSY
jgi:hypothetical protein